MTVYGTRKRLDRAIAEACRANGEVMYTNGRRAMMAPDSQAELDAYRKEQEQWAFLGARLAEVARAIKAFSLAVGLSSRLREKKNAQKTAVSKRGRSQRPTVGKPGPRA